MNEKVFFVRGSKKRAHVTISYDHSANSRSVDSIFVEWLPQISRAEAPTFRLGLRVRMRWKGANQTTHPAPQFSSIQMRAGHVRYSS
jgi:hypothetical protein